MSAVSHAYIYEGNETIGFKFDMESNPSNPEVVGAVQNRRVAMSDFSDNLTKYMEGNG